MNEPEQPPQPEYSESGVDRSVIRWFLEKTPAERLAYLQRYVSGILAIRARNADRIPLASFVH
jgi:hypothetical protein